jgi:hypothetical protein
MKIHSFLESNDSLLSLQMLTTGSYSEADETNQYPHTLFLQNPF